MNARLSLLLLLLTACSRAERPLGDSGHVGAQARAPRVAVTTDQNHYAMAEGPYGPETTIRATFTNPTTAPLYLVNCNGDFSIGLQERQPRGWTDVWSEEMNACLSAPIVINPGQSLTKTIVAASGAHAAVSSRENGTRISGGTYRVAWHGLYTTFDMRARPWGEELALDKRVSAPFIIDAPPISNSRRISAPERPAIIRHVEPEPGTVVHDREPISVTFASPTTALTSEPQLYIDREWIEKPRALFTESRPPASLELEYRPAKQWSPGRHEVRVIYRDAEKAMRWYSWSFEAERIQE